jgi:hypothetical protein
MKMKLKYMKPLFILTCMMLPSSMTALPFAQQDPFIKECLERLKNSRKYLILVG